MDKQKYLNKTKIVEKIYGRVVLEISIVKIDLSKLNN